MESIQLSSPSRVTLPLCFPWILRSVSANLLLFGCAALFGCGGGSDAPPPSPPAGGAVPGAPTSLAANAGDAALSLAWNAPADGGSTPVTGYHVSASPAVAQSQIVINGTAAAITGLTNGSEYTFAVAAVNSAGPGPQSTSLRVTPIALPGSFRTISVQNDQNSPTGIFDPALVNSSSTSGRVWLAYSSVNGHDVSTRIASSTDGGNTFMFAQTVGAATGPVVVTDTGPGNIVCGQPACTGRWVYEVPWMVEDPSDPDPGRRFKLFAHKYFLYPPRNPPNQYQLGAIIMWTASSPDGAWSAETPVMGWNLTPPEIPSPASNNLNQLNPADLSACLVFSEGSASVFENALDFALACDYPSGASGASIVSKIILLRSADHAKSFTYVGTLLQPSDASSFHNAQDFNAPALLPSPGNAPPVLIATPRTGQNGSLYSGCVIFPFASERAGTLIRTPNGLPVAIVIIPLATNRFQGACAWDRGLTVTGILMDDLPLSPFGPFGIVATRESF